VSIESNTESPIMDNMEFTFVIAPIRYNVFQIEDAAGRRPKNRSIRNHTNALSGIL